ncbi:MAG: ABC transporter ATP-binding protein [Rhodobacteraceae bacterium]|nr:ABC transporter ATP-binding protein [Paracoccaceae bacterium]
MLTVEDVSKIYQTREGPLTVLNGVSMNLQVGDTLALTGDSGAGKSTFLHLIGGLDCPDAGRITLAGIDLHGLDDGGQARMRCCMVGLIFQQFNLIPSLTVAQNMAFQARLAGRYNARFVTDLAVRLGLEQHLQHYPEQLSGGQQQRVAIGRTLAAKPRLILADEPTGSLDEATGDAVFTLLLGLAEDTGTAVLLVTHSTRLANRMGRRLHLRQGQLVVPAAPWAL